MPRHAADAAVITFDTPSYATHDASPRQIERRYADYAPASYYATEGRHCCRFRCHTFADGHIEIS